MAVSPTHREASAYGAGAVVSTTSSTAAKADSALAATAAAVAEVSAAAITVSSEATVTSASASAGAGGVIAASGGWVPPPVDIRDAADLVVFLRDTGAFPPESIAKATEIQRMTTTTGTELHALAPRIRALTDPDILTLGDLSSPAKLAEAKGLRTELVAILGRVNTLAPVLRDPMRNTIESFNELLAPVITVMTEAQARR